ncbi:MAG: hypothetical protein KAQ96_06345, partial [Thermoplasmata archaeon]|nr:hypothetical protein [Thermoplasmata archaeon]
DLGSNICLSINASDTVMVAFDENIDDLQRLSISMQIEPSPDLVISPTSFEMEEIQGATEPLWLSFNIENIGRAPSSSHWISVLRKPSAGTVFYEIVRVFESVEIQPGGSNGTDIFTKIPKGSCHIRIVIEDVAPFENNRSNNAFEVMVYIRVNNPPSVIVESPRDGAVVREGFQIIGQTNDIDGDEKVTTSITGFPGDVIELSGIGDWAASIDLSDIPSGDYVLVFQASDGDDVSIPVIRRVRVDPINESLRLLSFWPQGDITLLLGETGVYHLNVSERFGRPVTYRWSVDDVSSGSNGSMFYFYGTVIGEFQVKGVASNQIKSISSVWNITVRAPVMPTISVIDPTGDLELGKHQDQEFSIEVNNPDDQGNTVKWFSDGIPLDTEDDRAIVMNFETSGGHSVSVMVISSHGQDINTWQISVKNRPPNVTSWFPTEKIIILERPETIIFQVSALDPDGDDLSYSWICLNVTNSLSDHSDFNVTFDEAGFYRITLDISDGEDMTSIVWEVEVPADEPEPASDDDWWTEPVV